MLRAIQISHRARNQIQTCKRLFSTTNPEKGVAEEPSPDDKDKQIAMLQVSFYNSRTRTEEQ